MRRKDQRQGFLVSTILHLLFLMALSSYEGEAPTETEPTASVAPAARQRVFLPPAEVLRQLAPPPPAPPPPSARKDRVSVGAPVHRRQEGPLVLRRDDDLTQVAKGRADGLPGATAASPAPPRAAAGPDRRAEGEGVAWERSLVAPSDGGRRPDPARGTGERSIASSLRDLDRRLEQAGALGLPSGTGRQMGPLFFDPEGADFTLWMNHFKNEVYRNWLPPQAALLGFEGQVEIEFVVERDGRMSSLRILKSSGTASLDRAAEYALRGSRFLPLPADFRPARLPMRVTFIYGVVRPS